MNQQISGIEAVEEHGAAAPPAKGPPKPDPLNDMAGLLAEQLSACHAAAARCFAIANDEEDFDIAARLDALKLATKLVQASAAAASAVKRVKGGQFHHHVTVHRIDYAAEKAARKAREQAKEHPEDARKKLEERLDFLLEQHLARERLLEEWEQADEAEGNHHPVGGEAP